MVGQIEPSSASRSRSSTRRGYSIYSDWLCSSLSSYCLNALGVDFADDGETGRLSVFEPKTFNVIDSIPTDRDSDAVAYLAPAHTVLVANRDGHSLSFVDAAARRQTANIRLGGSWEEIVTER